MKRVYFSDVHLNVHRHNRGAYKYVWMSENKRDSFVSFLKYLNRIEDLREIILVGDILDNWVCPIDVVPPTYREILEAPFNAEIVAVLKLIDENPTKEIIYIPGNHDMDVDKATMKTYFPNMVFGGNQLSGALYVADGAVAEHGTSSAMFNGPDPGSDPVNKRPLGYFISRVAATAEARNQNDIKVIERILEAFSIFMFKKGSLGERVFNTIVSFAGLPEDEPIVMPDGSTVFFNDIRAKYSDIYGRWKNGKHLLGPDQAVAADAGCVDVMVDPLLKKNSAKIVILGHTHSEVNTPLPPPAPEAPFAEEVQALYENCGCWCDKKTTSDFVETEVIGKKHHVRMKYWDGVQAKTNGNTYYVKLDK